MAAFGGAHRTPATFEGTTRSGDGTVDVDFVALGDGRDDLFGRGIQGFEGAPEAETTRRPSINSNSGLETAPAGAPSRE
jgi:hypothetical protein